MHNTRKLILEEWISLDGYTCDKNGQLNFFAPHVRPSYDSPERKEFLSGIDTLLLGRRTYALFANLWPGRAVEQDMLAGKMNTAKKNVFSDSLSQAPWGTWPAAEIVSDNIVSRVTELKSVQGGNIVVWGSISLAQALMNANIVDEYHLHICPVFTGGGLKLFSNDLLPESLTLISSLHYGPGIVHLHYQKQ